MKFCVNVIENYFRELVFFLGKIVYLRYAPKCISGFMCLLFGVYIPSSRSTIAQQFFLAVEYQSVFDRFLFVVVLNLCCYVLLLREALYHRMYEMSMFVIINAYHKVAVFFCFRADDNFRFNQFYYLNECNI